MDYYDVTGTTPQEVRASLDQRSPDLHPRRRAPRRHHVWRYRLALHLPRPAELRDHRRHDHGENPGPVSAAGGRRPHARVAEAGVRPLRRAAHGVPEGSYRQSRRDRAADRHRHPRIARQQMVPRTGTVRRSPCREFDEAPAALAFRIRRCHAARQNAGRGIPRGRERGADREKRAPRRSEECARHRGEYSAGQSQSRGARIDRLRFLHHEGRTRADQRARRRRLHQRRRPHRAGHDGAGQYPVPQRARRSRASQGGCEDRSRRGDQGQPLAARGRGDRGLRLPAVRAAQFRRQCDDRRDFRARRPAQRLRAICKSPRRSSPATAAVHWST